MAVDPSQELQSWLPYWKVWKSCSKRPDDEHRARWDGMLEIFRALAGQPDATPDPIAFAAICKIRTQWLEELQSLDNWNADTNSLRLYRGITDGAAIAMRKALRSGVGRVRQFWPLSYSTDRSAALGFASKGHISGLVYSLNVPLSSVLLSDLTGYFRGGNSHKEMEIVVWHQQPLLIGIDDILKLDVSARKPPALNVVCDRDNLDFRFFVGLSQSACPLAEAPDPSYHCWSFGWSRDPFRSDDCLG